MAPRNTLNFNQKTLLCILVERRAEAAAWVAGCQADQQGEPGYTTRTTDCCSHLEGALGFGLHVFFPLLFFSWFLSYSVYK